ncbi:MAG: response regulator transcription factor [Anaerolineae bacterium]|nr:response regulator transcription factor [Anaerolineae bacterium]
MAIQRLLETQGYIALTATDGAKALELMEETQPDLILADVAMPHMNGYQLCERVRANPRWALIPFVFLTARALDSDVRYGKELGVDDYLIKPVDPDDMFAVVRGKLQRARQITQQISPLASSTEPGPRALTLGKLCVDPGQHRVWLDGEPLGLSATEFTLLEHLARQAGQMVSVQEMVKVTHGLDADHVEAGALIRPLIRSLQRKLGYPVGDMGCIENVRGVGYRLVPPDDD